MMKDLLDRLELRFGEAPAEPPETIADVSTLLRMANRKSDRRFIDKSVSVELLELLAAVALTAPTKSDMQQRDIIIVKDADVRGQIETCIPGQGWIPKAPELLVFLRQQQAATPDP